MSAFPQAVSVREVGPRDGFQNEPEVIPTAHKIELIDALARTGLRRLEVTSFVRPDVIPQLADAAAVIAAIDVPREVSVSVLIPNERGLEMALELRDRAHDHPRGNADDGRPGSGERPAFDEINVFMSASETHNRKNVNRSIAESLAGLEGVLGRARAAGLRCEGVISTSFGCPYEGRVPPERVLEIAACLRDAGAQEVGFGDTTGMANPVQVREFFVAASERLGTDVELTAHFHNTRGQGLANVLAALEAGVTSFESSFGELGGCPVPAGATGNIASEDLVSMLHEMGIHTGIDLDALLGCARRAQEILGRPLGSHTLVAGPVAWPTVEPGAPGLEADGVVVSEASSETSGELAGGERGL
jgi:hydroxymethylglutaryl-CoA lyase